MLKPTSKRDQKAILARILEQMDKAGLDVLLLTSAYDVYYSTGFCSRRLYRAGRMGNTMSVVTKDGQVSLVCGEFEKMVADRACDPSVNIVSYPEWIYIEDFASAGMKKEETQPDLNKTYRMALDLVPGDKSKMKLGMVRKWMTYDAGVFVKSVFGEENVVDCTRLLEEARIIKTPWEIDVLRYNAQISELAMYQIGKQLVPGMCAADVHVMYYKACQAIEPDITYVSQAHTFGSNFSPAWMPDHEPLKLGDLVRMDGGAYTESYKADVARTFAVGNKAAADREEVFQQLWNGHQFAVEHMGPGVRMCDLFKGIDEAIQLPGYVRGHYGHSISLDTSGEEYPFIGPKETRTFEPGMVMCVETPFYSSRRQTYNIEDTILITENGIEMFSCAPATMYI